MSNNEIKVSQALAEMMARTRYEDIPPMVIEDARRSVLDWLGSCLSGALEAPARMAQQVIAAWGHSE